MRINQKQVDQYIPIAYEALKDSEIAIAENGVIPKAFRGQISAFGAAIITGSLLSALAFFQVDENSKVKKSKLMGAIWYIFQKVGIAQGEENLFTYVKTQNQSRVCKQNILEAAIALKLAMNLYELKDDE